LIRQRYSHEGPSCTFCGKTAREVDKLIAGPAVFICDACVGAAEVFVRAEGTHSASPKTGGRDCSFCGGVCREILAEARPE
jgi:ATP-dependent protease Clp ATPase subunit